MEGATDGPVPEERARHSVTFVRPATDLNLEELEELESSVVFSRGEAIALWVGVILVIALLSCVFYKLCRVTVQ